MKTIHKYRLDESKVNTIRLPEGYRVVRSEYLITDKAVYVWIEEPLRVAIPRHEHQFRVVRSGEPVPEQYAYQGTALDTFGPEAYHVFEVIEACNSEQLPRQAKVADRAA